MPPYRGGMQPTPPDAAAIDRFLAEVAEVDGHPPLSGNKLAMIDAGSDRVGVWGDSEGICLVGVAAHHAGDGHWAVEAALASRRRGSAGEEEAIRSAAALVPDGDHHTLWAFRSRQIEAANRLGYVGGRSVLRMSAPMADVVRVPSSGVSVVPMAEADVGAIVAINNRAFADHPEQAAMTSESFDVLSRSRWFDPDGVAVARCEGGIVGFCVTKAEGSGVGEIYLLAVDPNSEGSGYGAMLASAGFEWLARRGATTASVWVDSTNHGAIRIYRKLGLAEDFRNREMTPATG